MFEHYGMRPNPWDFSEDDRDQFTEWIMKRLPDAAWAGYTHMENPRCDACMDLMRLHVWGLVDRYTYKLAVLDKPWWEITPDDEEKVGGRK